MGLGATCPCAAPAASRPATSCSTPGGADGGHGAGRSEIQGGRDGQRRTRASARVWRQGKPRAGGE
eukprot:10620754-Alexandrium_andersonii.AAC.1